MLNEKLPRLLSTYAYKSRLLATAAALLFVLYGAIFIGFYTPGHGPLFRWRPDAQLTVLSVPDDSQLLPGDQVLAIDGMAPVRMRPIYPLPLKSAYTFTIQRGSETRAFSVSVTLPPILAELWPFVPTTILALVGWLVGTIILLFADKENDDALATGYIFLLSAVVLMGIQASLEGAPGAWLAGHSGIFILAVGWVYLGTIPRTAPLTPRVKQVFGGLLLGALLLAGAAVFEVLYLFPRHTSFQEIIGLSLYALGFLLAGMGLIIGVVLVALRCWQLPRGQYLRQQLNILLIFMGIGTVPTMLLTVMPRALWDVTLLPFPLAIGLMLFIPLGYLFVIYRRGFLKLDIIFGHIAHLMLLGLLVFGFYIGTLYLIQRWWVLSGQDLLLPATIVFFPALLIAVFASKPISQFVQQAMFDSSFLSQAKLAEMTASLSLRPELATLEKMVAMMAQMFQVAQTVLVLTNDKGQLVPLGQGQLPSSVLGSLASVKTIQSPLLRSRSADRQQYKALFTAVPWAELLIPVQIRQEPIGLLVLSRPGGQGFFNARQLDFLTQAAGVLAVGSENITLFEATLRLSRDRLAFQEQERRKLSQQIHDDPLQQITYATTILDQVVRQAPEVSATYPLLPSAAGHLRQSAQTLREICIGLYPPMQEQGIELAIQEIVAQFQTKYGVQTAVTIAPQLQRCITWVSDQQVTAVCRILTEALNNVMKHAPGASVTVALACVQNQLELSIQDNGPGTLFMHRSFSELMRQGHMGIVGMYEWARVVDGQLRFTPNEPSGLGVFFSCPLASNESDLAMASRHPAETAPD